MSKNFSFSTFGSIKNLRLTLWTKKFYDSQRFSFLKPGTHMEWFKSVSKSYKSREWAKICLFFPDTSIIINLGISAAGKIGQKMYRNVKSGFLNLQYFLRLRRLTATVFRFSNNFIEAIQNIRYFKCLQQDRKKVENHQLTNRQHWFNFILLEKYSSHETIP